jgi:hypothetical protein
VLTDIIVDIQQRETGAPLEEAVVAELREIADTYDVDRSPSWLEPIFTAVQQGRAISPPVFFEFEGSDPHSYLAEAAELLHWQFESEGEYTLIAFPRLGWRIYISHEASSPTGKSGSKYDVAPITKAA